MCGACVHRLRQGMYSLCAGAFGKLRRRGSRSSEDEVAGEDLKVRRKRKRGGFMICEIGVLTAGHVEGAPFCQSTVPCAVSPFLRARETRRGHHLPATSANTPAVIWPVISKQTRNCSREYIIQQSPWRNGLANSPKDLRDAKISRGSCITERPERTTLYGH